MDGTREMGPGRARRTALRLLSLWAPPLLWSGIIFSLSSLPGLDSGLSWDFLLRKIAHMAEYAVLFFLWLRAMQSTDRRAVLIAAALAVGYSAGDEFHQSLVPGRHMAASDVAIDGLGVAIAWLTWRSLRERRRAGGRSGGR